MLNQPNTISLCMIVKDEEQYIEKCLQSTQDVVNEIIVVDTGSTDRTIEIAESFGAKIFHFSWNNDFSEARNFSLAQALGGWVLFLDADEELDHRDRHKLKETVRIAEADAFLFKVHSYVGEENNESDILLDGRVSLFRNQKEFRFKGAIHEEITSSIKKYGEYGIKPCGIRIIHYGYLDHVIERKKKTDRNKQIIHQELGKNNSNLFIKYALAVEFLQEGKYDSATEVLLNVVNKLTREDPFYSDALYKLCIAMKESKKLTECKCWLEKGLHIFPDYTDLYFLLGSIHLEAGELDEAERLFQHCISLGPSPETYYSIEGIGTFRAWFTLGMIYETRKAIRKAIDAYLCAVQQNYQFNEALLRCMICLTQEMDQEEFHLFIANHFDIKHPPTFLSIGQTLLRIHRFNYLLYLVEDETVLKHSPLNYVHFSMLCEKAYHNVLKQGRKVSSHGK